ncbi:MAG: SpvB/TcaC N-terminal domain-containing protein [Sphingopyxis sp.]|uniref:SpvB/TcaC N-terminal domain-containing protein n=1 Tax=Sphingopyxis sp. TaxID=1908224 RepID=UPI002AB893F9|nr:SpvB/TcaC N-terminal domain-containing protein [Sphingopyxis sp.]MDZ3833116.1 SpvB/TcaC N-terminal domain-containing protein [Sphingopyxis sp.]
MELAQPDGYGVAQDAARSPERGSDAAVRAPQIVLPEGGRLSGYSEALQSDPATGSPIYAIPLPATPGRGSTPELALQYSTASANGIFGVGFSLTLPAISRQTDTGIPQYAGGDRFLFAGQQLVPRYEESAPGTWRPATRYVTGGPGGADVEYRVTPYRPRVETAFDLIEHWEDMATGISHWRIVDAQSNETLLGTNDLSRVYDPAAPTHIFEWLIDSHADTHGNRTEYRYKAENGENVPDTLANRGRDHRARRYIERISYGNYHEAAGTETFGFHILFDYGEYDLAALADNPDLLPSRPWPVRPDPFSSYRSGFEIRTYRRCNAVLMVHAFPAETGIAQCVTAVTQFQYSDDATGSQILSAQRSGYRYAGGAYAVRPAPATGFDYVPFQPEAYALGELQCAGQTDFPGMLDGGLYRLVDLYGDGIPGILYASATSLLYWRPLGEGRYDDPVLLPQAPSEFRLEQPGYGLIDINGDGALDLVVGTAARAGFYANDGHGGWRGFRSFRRFPSGFLQDDSVFSDLTGDGLADLYAPAPGRVRFYPSLSDAGYGPPRAAPNETAVPEQDRDGQSGFVGFVDIFGDGVPARLILTSGRVQAWPNLGHGRFAAPVTFAGAPIFSTQLRLDRVLWADVDGSGYPSLLLVYPGTIEIYRNESGNAFAAPIRVDIPIDLSDTDQLSVADVFGNGSSCLVICRAGAPVRHFYIDLSARTRPKLLRRVDNHCGRLIELAFRSSTDFYLAARAQGAPWVTRLPTPIWLLTQMIDTDLVAVTTAQRACEYRDGYFDPVERKFLGFAYSQSQDTQRFGDDIWQFPAPVQVQAPSAAGARPVRGAFTRSWFESGAFVLGPALAAEARADWFSEGPDALVLPPDQFAPDILASDAETRRQACAALAGSQLRQELYQIDEQGMPGAAPLSVTQSNRYVRMLQPRVDGHYAVFQIVPRENATSQYEAAADDPRITHSFTLESDGFGLPVLTADICYGRRTLPAGAPPRQQILLASATRTRFINVETPFHLIGRDYEEIAYTLNGLSPAPGRYFSFDQCRTQVAQALDNSVAFGEPFPPATPAARVEHWRRTLFWNAERTAALPLGQITPEALLYNESHALFPQTLVDHVYDPAIVTPALLTGRGGYLFDASNGYWWNPGEIAHYGGADSYYALNTTADPFGAETSYGYDAYWLAAISSTDALGQTVRSRFDYQAMKTAAVTDLNGTVSEVCFDPLGQVVVATRYDRQDGVLNGNQPLADYVEQPLATGAAVLADPEKYLQGASSFFAYDLFAWERDGTPVNSVSLSRIDWYYRADGSPAPPSSIRRTVDYVDASSRPSGTVTAVDSAAVAPGDAPPAASDGEDPLSWIVSNRTLLNERGEPVRRYAAYFAATPGFGPVPDAPFTAYIYDAAGRLVRTDTPDGYFRTTAYHAWSEVIRDEDDNVLLSEPYRRIVIDNGPATPELRAALERTALLADTPTSWDVDPRGNKIQQTQINTLDDNGTIGRFSMITSYWVNMAGDNLRIADPRFYDPAHPDTPSAFNFVNILDMAGAVLSSHSADAGLATILTDALGGMIEHWNARGFRLSTTFDTLHREIDKRVIGGGIDQIVERHEYGTAPATRSVNRIVRSYGEAGVVEVGGYDLSGEPQSTITQLARDGKSLPDWDDPAAVPMLPERWPQSWQRNALGEIQRAGNADGSETQYSCYLNGWLRALSVALPGAAAPTPVIAAQSFNALGGRRVAAYANGVRTDYRYDPATYRLTGIQSVRSADARLLQDVSYTYDPVGNVSNMTDATQPVCFFDGQTSSGAHNYSYDAIYALIEATGRQQVPDAPGQLEPYRRSFTYDLSGNITRIRTAANSSAGSGTSDFAVAATSNHAVPADMIEGGKTPDDFYDATGNLIGLRQPVPDPDLSALAFDFRNALASAVITPRASGDPDAAWFSYDPGGRRMRKLVQRLTASGNRIEDSFYIGDVVIVRAAAEGEQPSEQTVSLKLVVAGQCVLVTNATQPIDQPDGPRTFRYQLDDLLGSVNFEVDDQAQIISYEEYYPYGAAAVVGGVNTAEVERKRYRFTGKELDRATGLYYFGARYYSPWMGRWITPDPAGPVDRINLYTYADNNPATLVDRTGNNPLTPEEEAYWLNLIDTQYRFLTPQEWDANSVVALYESQEIRMSNSLLFADENQRFSPTLEKTIVDKFSEFGGLFFFNNPVLANYWDTANSRLTFPSTGSDMRKDYALTRSHLTKVVSDEDFGLEFSSPFETHHLQLKSIHPELAVETMNFALTTRGSSSKGMIGLHEGLFHTLTAGNMGSLFSTEVPAVTGLIKRITANQLGLDITDTSALQAAGYGWLELEDRSKGKPVKIFDISTSQKKKELQAHKLKLDRVSKAYKFRDGGILKSNRRAKVQKLAKKATVSSSQFQFSSDDL